MPVFAVMLRGENFWIRDDDKVTRFGFYTTRYVFRRTQDDAAAAAILIVQKYKLLITTVVREAPSPPMLFIENIVRCPIWQIFRSGKGFTLWDMDALPDVDSSD